MGQDEQSLPLVACANFRRRKQAERTTEIQSFQFSDDALSPSSAKHPWDILDEDKLDRWIRLNESMHCWP